MKFIREELGANKHPRYCFAMGKKEARLLYAALENAKRWMPHVPATVQDHHRLSNMIKVLHKSLGEMIDDVEFLAPPQKEEGKVARTDRELKVGEIPRRARVDLYTTAELAVREAIQRVEELPPDERLTKAAILLGDAQSWIADYVDNVAIKDHFPRPLLPEGGVREVIRKIEALGEDTFIGNNVHGECKACGNKVHLRDTDIPVNTLWPYKQILLLLRSLLSQQEGTR